MAKVRSRIAMSLDGYTAGIRQSKENPPGIGGTRLHEWAYPLAAWGAGLVDEMEIHLPMLLSAGERLFEGVRDLGGLQLVRTVAAPDVTHLKFVRR